MSQNGIGYSDVKIEIGKNKIKKVRLAKKTGFFASACAAALSRIVDKFPNPYLAHFHEFRLLDENNLLI
jgi:hypothetical protein